MDATDIAIGTGIAVANVVAVFVIYGLTRAIWGGRQTAETKDLAASVLFRVASLQGLILALVFAQELEEYSEIRSDLVAEATAVADIFNDIRRYDTPRMDEVRTTLAAYVRHVVDEEWPTLSSAGQLSAQGWQYREEVYQTVLDLMPETPRQEALRAHMIESAQRIAELRQQRENDAVRGLSPLFWFAALVGTVCVAVPFFTFAPTVLNLALLSLYGGYTGVVMSVIFAFSDPFAQPGALAPTAFTQLLRTEIADY